MEHRTTYEEMLRVRESLKNMRAYLVRLKKHVEHKTPGHQLIDRLSAANDAIFTASNYFGNWSGGLENGSLSGWEDEERAKG